VAAYNYTDEHGTLLFQTVRMEPKDFSQRRPDPQKPGDWIWNLNGVRRVLYRLPELKSALAAGRTVFIAEGEKDVDALVKHGFAATCNPMGADERASKWLPEHTESIRGAARVVVIADKDKPNPKTHVRTGHAFACEVARRLLGVTRSVKVIELPDANGKSVKDAFDFFAAGGTADQLRAIVTAAPNFAPAPEPPTTEKGSVATEYLGNEADDADDDEPLMGTTWPKRLAPEAFYGLAGDVVRLIEPHSESDPAGVLLMFLAAFGNLAGAAAHFTAEARKHPMRIWPVLVGETAKGRKGSGWSSLRFLLAQVDEHWLAHCAASGLSSGEGLIWAVRDPIIRRRRSKDGITEEQTEDEGVTDKRLFTVEEEFSAVLKAASREGNTVSDILRRAWDHGDLRTMTKNSPARATGAHVTVVGHITKPDLSGLLRETDALNGFGNRFLWLAVRRSKLLPEGGALHAANFEPLILRLRAALDCARKAALLTRSNAARELWSTVYPTLTADRAGLTGALTNRAEAQVMRLALAYALLDGQSLIDVPHLRAALAVWDFCERSTRFIFGDSLGDRVADRILDALRVARSSGLTRNDLRELFSRNILSAQINEALALLTRLGLAEHGREQRNEQGRPTTVWRAKPYAKNAINAVSAPKHDPTAFSAFRASAERCAERSVTTNESLATTELVEELA